MNSFLGGLSVTNAHMQVALTYTYLIPLVIIMFSRVDIQPRVISI